MDILERLNGVVEYLEERVTDCKPIDSNVLSRIAAIPGAQLMRMFAYVAGVPMYEYVRRRRLTLAAAELIDGDVRVIDVAFKFGYESPDAFTRAFTQMHGVSPRTVRQNGVSLSAYPRLMFQIQIRGAEKMNYKLIEKPAFRVMGIKASVNALTNEQEGTIMKLWDRSIHDGCFNELVSLSSEPFGVMGVCSSVEMAGDFDYYIAVEMKQDMDKSKWDVLNVPASTWAIFEAVGPMPHTIQELWKNVMTEWLPSSGYKHAGTPDMEVYSAGDNHASDYKSYIWIPVVKAE